MAGGYKETDPEKLAQSCESFMVGTSKQYDKQDGDMWFFELYHHLRDCADALRKKPTEPPGRRGTAGVKQ